MNDPLNISIPLEGVDVDMPLLPEGDYPAQIKESTPKPNKRGDGYNWNLKFGLSTNAVAVDGREIHPDFPLFHVVALQPAPDSTDKDAYLRGLSETIDGIFGTNKTNRPNFNKELWERAVGQIVKLRLTIDEYKGVKSNKVKKIVKENV